MDLKSMARDLLYVFNLANWNMETQPSPNVQQYSHNAIFWKYMSVAFKNKIFPQHWIQQYPRQK
jgi:hypothetical protein